jgi:hypothetical protein
VSCAKDGVKGEQGHRLHPARQRNAALGRAARGLGLPPRQPLGEWILDQHKEKTPKDPTIREKFNNYRFADHKEKIVDLLMRVTRVSVETVATVEAMRELPRT